MTKMYCEYIDTTHTLKNTTGAWVYCRQFAIPRPVYFLLVVRQVSSLVHLHRIIKQAKIEYPYVAYVLCDVGRVELSSDRLAYKLQVY